MAVDTVYLTDGQNVALFPGENGYFSSVDLVPHGQYEVNGEAPRPPTTTAPTERPRFSFLQPSTSSTHGMTAPGIPPIPTASRHAGRPYSRCAYVAGVNR